MTTDEADAAWTYRRGDAIVYRDTDEHARLVARTLNIDPSTWARVLRGYRARWDAELDTPARLAALAAAFAEEVPEVAPDTATVVRPCPICERAELTPAVARRSDDVPRVTTWARCATCGHGALVAGAAPPTVYGSGAYYRSTDAGGAGYRDYLAEKAYREARGATLLERVMAASGRRPRDMLEVGSGYGFTRGAAERLGIATVGVDVNPDAAATAARLYGFRTFTGTLADALAAKDGPVGMSGLDLVLYQFVLEHVCDPIAELRDAVRALRPGGALAVLVPSMHAVELDVFRSAYRSLRRDHLHLFSPDSLARALRAVGARPVALETGCNLHLLAPILSPGALAGLYHSGRGPDLLGVALREGSSTA